MSPYWKEPTAEELLDGEGVTGRLELEADCSTLTGICTAREIQITGARREQGITLSDGTAGEIWDTAFFGTNYILPDGTELLRENRPSGPQNVHVGGVEGFDQLSAPAREAVASYYAEQGLLYNVEEVLERAYADYRDGRRGLFQPIWWSSPCPHPPPMNGSCISPPRCSAPLTAARLRRLPCPPSLTGDRGEAGHLVPVRGSGGGGPGGPAG